MWKNDITGRLRIDYPIIQAPMFGVTTPEMVASAAGVGCLGSLPFGDLTPDKCLELIRATKKITNKHFAINLFVNSLPTITDETRKKYSKAKEFIQNFAARNNLAVNLPDIDDLKLITYHEQVDTIINEGCKVVSFTFGNLDDATIKKFKNNNVTLIGTCTSVDEALLLERSGIDIICVQGLEAGGHRGSFPGPAIPKIGGFSLLAQVFDRVKVPIIYAGGIYNARTLTAAKTLGAQGFQIGSMLLCSPESSLKQFEKDRLKTITQNDIVLTRSFSGRYARGIRNGFVKEIEDSEYILPYPLQNKLTGELRRMAKASGNIDFVSVWAGQSIGNFSDQSTGEVIKGLINAVDSQDENS